MMKLSAALLVSCVSAIWNRPDIWQHHVNDCDTWTISNYKFRVNGANICETGNVHHCNDGECHCEMRSGKSHPIRYQRRSPESNGCSMPLWPGDENCCDNHDWCYCTAGRSKQSCEDDFCGCLSWWNRWAPPPPTPAHCVGSIFTYNHYYDSQRDYVGCLYLPAWVGSFYESFNTRRRMEGEDDVIVIDVDESGNPIGKYAYLAGNSTDSGADDETAAANLLARLVGDEESDA